MAQTYTAYVVSVRRIPGDTMADYVFEYEADGKKLRVTSRERSNSTAAEGHDWSGLKAVQNGKVYKIPLGTYYWFATTYDSPLMMLWMAMKQLPERSAVIMKMSHAFSPNFRAVRSA